MRGLGVVHRELARADRHRRRTLPSTAEGPAARDRLPEVLIVGQAVPPGPKLMLPMPFDLIDQFEVPVDVHAPTLGSGPDQTENDPDRIRSRTEDHLAGRVHPRPETDLSRTS